ERVAAGNAPPDSRRAGNRYRYTLKTNVPFPTSVDQGAGTELSSLCSWLPSPRWRGGRLAVSSMSVQNGFAASLPRPSVQTIAGMALRLATLLAILAALLFLPAGRWNWPEAWALLGA